MFNSGTIVEPKLDAACVTNTDYVFVKGKHLAPVLALWAVPGTVTGHSEDRTNGGKAYLVAVKVSFWDGSTTWILVEGLAMAPANCVGAPQGEQKAK